MIKPTHHIFVCTSSRPNGQQKGFCHSKDAFAIMETLLEEINDRGLGGEVFVTNTGCLGFCEKGPIVIVYPENIWYFSVSPDNVEEIIEEHIEGGNPVERLMSPE
ncbi:2Fe-2S ferredoxin [Dethiobacter alkaliphilus]|uniref:Ferredoxin, 2Fe-2S n=1 Tax=Dethiobacter alkaliphilus AHT 1 TaxID=555088 RepID=C0GKD0_DETAL|nr:2Fe-2S ferredoxin [Dethiobacter alkaliphilus]EEG76173.1 ferredoxin, 2Fe-2S [Dethiobacter alkaliphilus AHT 1]MCW3490778.1 (2Fe-2S) ferredoxin domain-containing protein [Dethiobacter alkaliphilus]